MTESKYIWRNGRLIPWAEATTHVMSHALHYGTSVFEGIRVYDTPEGPSVFRLREHVERLFDSAAIYRMKIPYPFDTIYQACKETVAANDLKTSYIRPVAYYGYGKLGVTPAEDHPIEVFIAAFPWGAYLGEEGQTKGVDVCISSWSRVAPNTIPPMAKAGGNYLSGVLIGQEARRHGYVEGIALSPDGTLSEGAGENVFLVRNGILYTPNAACSMLAGITRDSAITITKDMGLEVREERISREMIYLADEIFFTGTAVEITPVRSVDRHPIGNGERGPITRKIQQTFFGLFNGETKDKWGWLDPVAEAAPKARASNG